MPSATPPGMTRLALQLLVPIVAVPLAIVVGCSSDDEPDRDASASVSASASGTGASGGEGAAPNTGGGGAGAEGGSNVGGGGAGGEGGQGDTQADHDALAACGAPTCAKLFAQRIEGGEPFTINDSPCVLEGLRDRTEGAYDIELDHTWGNGSDTRNIRIFVTASGEVEVGEALTGWFDDNPPETTLLPTQRCMLEDSAFFEQCLGYIESGDPDGGPDAYPEEAYDCIFPSLDQGVPWFTGCQPLAPTCE